MVWGPAWNCWSGSGCRQTGRQWRTAFWRLGTTPANVSVGWGEFIRLGGAIMVVQIVGAIFYVLTLHGLDLIPSL